MDIPASTSRGWVSFPLLVTLGVLAWGLLAGNVFLDGDPYWHLAVGKWIVSHRAVPTTEFYSFSMRGIPWTAHEWLSEVVMYGTFQLGSWRALQILVSLCFAVTAGYMMRFLLDRMEPVYAIAACAVCLGVTYSHFMGRPHVFVWPIVVVWVGELVKAGERRTAPSWWLLPMLVGWANLHASFTLALGFAGALAADAVMQESSSAARLTVARRWAPFLLASGVAVLINPRGIGAITHAFGVMQMKETLNVIGEWRSADFHEFQVWLLWLALVVAAGVTGRLRLSPIRALFILGLIYLALKHQRYHSLCGLVSPFILAAPLGVGVRSAADATRTNAATLDSVFAYLARPARGIAVILTGIVSAALIAAVHGTLPREPQKSVRPDAALAAFARTGVTGHVLNAYVLGGYLIFKGVPVFIDGRADMYGDPFMKETGDALSLRKPRAFENLLAKYRIAWTLLGPETPAVELLDHLPAWQRIYGDSVAVVHVRRDLLNAATSQSR